MRFPVVLLVAACGSSSPSFDPGRGLGVFTSLPLDDAPPGLSDLATDPAGTPWTIPERVRELLAITVTPDKATFTSTPIEGVPDGVDAESLVWLGPDRVAIGLEGQDYPYAAIAFADRKGAGFVVSKLQELKDLGVDMKKNHGVEGMCANKDGELLAAIEERGKLPDGSWYAPLVRVTGETTTVGKVKLSTDVGKIAALNCTSFDDIVAIERHYGVSRVVKFALADVATETVLIDLAPILHDSLNLEGIVRLADGRMLAISDNQGKTVSGPGYVLVFPKR